MGDSIMKGKREIIFAILIAASLCGSLYAQESNQKKTLTVGVVMDGPWDRNEEIFVLFRKEINDLLARDYDILFPADKTITSDWTKEGIHSALDKVLSDPDIDIVLAGGLIASADVCQRSEFPRPVIAPFILDLELQGLPLENGTSGVHNLNYIVTPDRFVTDMDAYRDIVAFKKPSMLISRLTSELYPDLQRNVEGKANELGITLNTIIVGTSVGQALDKLPPDADAVLLTALYPLQEEETNDIIQGLINRKLPGFTSLMRDDVERGIYAGRVPEDHFQRRARRVALNIQRILFGEDPGTIPVVMHDNFKMIINMETARAIQVYPNFSAMSEAELLKPTREEAKRKITFAGAIEEAVRENLTLSEKQRYVAAGKQDIRQARSNLLPRLELSALETVIDKDIAESSMGQQAERTLSGSATFTQLLYSEPAWANLSIQKKIQTTREKELEALKLDIAGTTASAYLDLLKAKTVENIQRENLRLTRSHLEIARVRRAIGMSGPADVFRLESKIASDRLNVIGAISYRNAQEIQLNRLLHRPLEEAFTTEEMSIEDVQLLISDPRILNYFKNQWSFKLLRKILVQFGLESSPELQGLNAAISAKERALASSKRAYYIPTLGLQGEIANKFSRSGAGSEGGKIDIPGAGSLDLGSPKDDSWWFGINLSFPLYEGGAKRAAHQKMKEEVRQLKVSRDAAAEQIEQRIRFALHFTGTSFAGISLSRDAADAAHKGLELVEDSFAQGVVSIIDLLDAQNAALNAELAAANAEYDFISDLVEVQRAIGQVDLSVTEKEKSDLIRRLETNVDN